MAKKAVPHNDSPALVPLVVDGTAVVHVRPAHRAPTWTLLKFSRAAQSGLGTDDPGSLNLMLDAIQKSVHPDDWAKFDAACDEHQPDGSELLDVVAGLLEAHSALPTKRSSGSPAGPKSTRGTSVVELFSRATVPPGRTDLEAAHRQMREFYGTGTGSA